MHKTEHNKNRDHHPMAEKEKSVDSSARKNTQTIVIKPKQRKPQSEAKVKGETRDNTNNEVHGKTGESTQAKKKGKRKLSKALRKKRKKQKEETENRLGKNASTSRGQRRDFSSDLHDYLEEWVEREESGTWKFNKNLQTYALDHCMDVNRIDPTLFNKLVPYINSVMGVSRNRLLDHCRRKAEEYESKDDEEKDKDGDDLVSAIARANLIIKILTS